MSASGKAKDVRNILKQIEDLGHKVVLSNNGHWKVLLPGRTPIFLPQTPSDMRSLRNAIALLRRNGIEIKRA